MLVIKHLTRQFWPLELFSMSDFLTEQSWYFNDIRRPNSPRLKCIHTDRGDHVLVIKMILSKANFAALRQSEALPLFSGEKLGMGFQTGRAPDLGDHYTVSVIALGFLSRRKQ